MTRRGINQVAPISGLGLCAAALLLGSHPAPAPGAANGVAQPETLPVFELSAPDTTAAGLLGVARALGLPDITPARRGERWVIERGSRVAEIFTASGGVWIADRARLWNPELRPVLPDPDSAQKLSEGFMAAVRRLSQPQDSIVRWDTTPGQTVMVRFQQRPMAGRVERVLLDRQVTYQARVRVSGTDFPVVGGGGKFTFVLGDAGRLIGLSGVWRPIARVVEHAALVPRTAADSQFRALTRGLRLATTNVTLAYYSGPPSVRQRYLYPVWVYSADELIDGERLPLRSVIIPATRFGPALPPRGADARSRESRLCPGSASPGRRESVTGEKSPPFEAGTAWIRLGLRHTPENAQGFLDALAAAGWRANFRRGGPEACMSHWTELDDQWVDEADIVFYTGHAGPGGWQLNPGNKFLDHQVTGKAGEEPRDLWGERDLEWLIIAACGPLQDVETGDTGMDVFARWGGAFDGLHLLMGYASRSFDTPAEGRTLVRYALEGEPLLWAWLHTARETQGSVAGGKRVWAGVMYPFKGTQDPSDDRLWGVGSVSPVSTDLDDPDGFVAIWTTI